MAAKVAKFFEKYQNFDLFIYLFIFREMCKVSVDFSA